MNTEIRTHLKREVDRLQKVRFECDRRLRMAWGIGCVACGGDIEETNPGCTNCHERQRSRVRRAAVGVLAPGDRRHGNNGYANYGCRCDLCRAGRRAYFARVRMA